MTRIVLMLIVTLSLLGHAASLIAVAEDSNSQRKPNIIVVLFDDMGWGQPRSYNPDSALRTPNFDRLAAQGMRMTDAHSASAVCTPTRYGLLTGRYPWRIGQFGVLTTYSAPIIPTHRSTIASLLKQQGYTTACIGKWHLGLNWVGNKLGKKQEPPLEARFTEGPNALGFDYFYGFTHARNIGTILEQDRVVEHVAAVENQPLMIAKALEWIGERKPEEPFFLYFPMCPPHEPIVPSDEYAGKSSAQDLVGKNPKYGDWLYQGDAMLGQIMAALEKHHLAENTLLIATSDNGAEHRAYAPLRESKRSIYEGGHRVPFVVRWPGKVKAGSTWNHTICLNDILATSCEIVGAKLPAACGEDSVSFLPALLGMSDKPTREATVHQSMAGDLAIRQGPWKLIFHKNGQRELFDLADDISERSDQLKENDAEVEKLSSLMQNYIDQGRSTLGETQQNEHPLSLQGEKPMKQPKKASPTK